MKLLAQKLDVPFAAPAVSSEHLRDALGNAALEGLRPESSDLADLEQVIEGNPSGSEYLDRIKARYVIPA